MKTGGALRRRDGSRLESSLSSDAIGVYKVVFSDIFGGAGGRKLSELLAVIRL